MRKTLKQFFSGAWIIVAIAAFILIPIFLISWYTANFDWIYSILVNISGIVIWTILPLALLISLIPRAREITGTTIVICSWALGVILWLINLYNSIATVGFVWTIFGIVFVGVGVFITSGIGLILNGEFSGLIFMLLMLAGIYGIRLLGHWIATKKPSRPSKKEIEKMADDTALILSKGKTDAKNADLIVADVKIKRIFDITENTQRFIDELGVDFENEDLALSIVQKLTDYIKRYFEYTSLDENQRKLLASSVVNDLYKWSSHATKMDRASDFFLKVVMKDLFSELRKYDVNIVYVIDNAMDASRLEAFERTFSRSGFEVVVLQAADIDKMKKELEQKPTRHFLFISNNLDWSKEDLASFFEFMSGLSAKGYFPIFRNEASTSQNHRVWGVVMPVWTLRGYDTFEGMPYKIPGEFDSESLAQEAAEKYLKEKIEPLQGKPTVGGIQDRISIIRPDGTNYRYKDPV